MVSFLGAQIEDSANLKTEFPHSSTSDSVFFYLDPRHIIKLTRNCLATKGGEILHLQWEREKMKLKIAAQTFSNSVADALLFLSEDLQLKEFKNASVTAKFCEVMNNLFVTLNTRNWASKARYTKPPCGKNYNKIHTYLLFYKEYIQGLKLNGVVLQTNRKTGILSLLICIDSLLGMYQKDIQTGVPLLRYILTYKISQDYLEISFSAVRGKFGSNNNPTCRKFKEAYKRLLLHTEIKGADSRNALALDNKSILCCSNDDLLDSEDFVGLSRKLEDYMSAQVWHLATYTSDTSKEDLENAVQAVCGRHSIRKVSKKFSISFSTLQERIKKTRPIIIGPSLGSHLTFSPEEEKSIAENIKLLAKLFYGPSPLEVLLAAYIYVEKYNIKHRFNRKRKLAGKVCLYGILKRNSLITICQPEAASINPVTAFNKEEMALFFKHLGDIKKKHLFTASKIYNMDETIVAEKRQKRVGMQPLDVTFVPYDVASIFNKPYCDTATIQKEVYGSKASGIMPIDLTVFGEKDILASDYLLGTENDTVTVMNDPTANLKNQD
ncbi:hypothetical protein ILUMI_13641 [Ignelater luminosus]|uniref:Transposase n=1 Tax=Ignelater luminosus TaxID=2038154 RepID=A0A8K0CWC0_IGNLU|nr:hypothetical protein ILUMI_13641 [Ignelater luminosus]